MKDANIQNSWIQRRPYKVIIVFITVWSFFNEAITYGGRGGRRKLYGRIKSRLSKLYSVIWRDYFFRSTALITAIAFFITSLPLESAWAARTPLELSRVGSNRAGSPGSIKTLNVETFSLPAYLGHVKDSWISSPGRETVIHIQDAHCNYAAQHKIRDIIEYLNKEYGINTVNLEGGAGEYDLSLFTDIEDKYIREKVADYFVKEGIVNGTEYFAINNPDDVTLWGVEDAKLYIENLKIYRESLKYKDEVDKHLSALEHILSNLKRHIYSDELLELDTKYEEYKAEKLEFKDYLNFLIHSAREKAINIKSLTNIYLLHQSLEQEENIDFKKANIERKKLIDSLEKILSRNELEELVLKTVEFKRETVTQKDFYGYLIEKAKSTNLELKDFPELHKYIIYISIYNAVDKTKITKELDELENIIKETLYKNEKQKELNKLSKNFALTRNLFKVTLTREDYEYYLKNKDSFNIRNFVTFINKEAPIYKITATLDSDITNLDRCRENIAKFYEYSFKRDEAFVENMKFSPQVTLLVTGGFHTENLCELFKKNNIAYISIMPNFKNGDGYESPYFRLLSQEKDEENKKILEILHSFVLAIASILTPLGEKVRGKEAKFADMIMVKMAMAKIAGLNGIKVIHGDTERYFNLDWVELDPAKVSGQFELVSLPSLAGLELEAPKEKVQVAAPPAPTKSEGPAASVRGTLITGLGFLIGGGALILLPGFNILGITLLAMGWVTFSTGLHAFLIKLFEGAGLRGAWKAEIATKGTDLYTPNWRMQLPSLERGQIWVHEALHFTRLPHPLIYLMQTFLSPFTAIIGERSLVKIAIETPVLGLTTLFHILDFIPELIGTAITTGMLVGNSLVVKIGRKRNLHIATPRPATDGKTLEFAKRADVISRRELLRKGVILGIGAVVAGTIGNSIFRAVAGSIKEDIPLIDPDLAEDLTEVLKESEELIGEITARRISASIKMSNEKYQGLVKEAYQLLRKKGLWSKDKEAYPVLFLEGLARQGFALAVAELGIIVVGLGELKTIKPKDMAAWLAHKITHEGQHIINRKDKPYISPLEDEESAYRVTWRSIVAFEGESSQQAQVQELVYRAFSVVVNNKKETCNRLGVKDFNSLNYRNIEVLGRFVGIELFDFRTMGKEPQFLWIDVDNGAFLEEKPKLKYEYMELKEGRAPSLPAVDYALHALGRPNRSVTAILASSALTALLQPPQPATAPEGPAGGTTLQNVVPLFTIIGLVVGYFSGFALPVFVGLFLDFGLPMLREIGSYKKITKQPAPQRPQELVSNISANVLKMQELQEEQMPLLIEADNAMHELSTMLRTERPKETLDEGKISNLVNRVIEIMNIVNKIQHESAILWIEARRMLDRWDVQEYLDEETWRQYEEDMKKADSNITSRWIRLQDMADTVRIRGGYVTERLRAKVVEKRKLGLALIDTLKRKIGQIDEITKAHTEQHMSFDEALPILARRIDIMDSLREDYQRLTGCLSCLEDKEREEAEELISVARKLADTSTITPSYLSGFDSFANALFKNSVFSNISNIRIFIKDYNYSSVSILETLSPDNAVRVLSAFRKQLKDTYGVEFKIRELATEDPVIELLIPDVNDEKNWNKYWSNQEEAEKAVEAFMFLASITSLALRNRKHFENMQRRDALIITLRAHGDIPFKMSGNRLMVDREKLRQRFLSGEEVEIADGTAEAITLAELAYRFNIYQLEISKHETEKRIEFLTSGDALLPANAAEIASLERKLLRINNALEDQRRMRREEVASTPTEPEGRTATLVLPATQARFGHLHPILVGWIAAVTEFFNSLRPVRFVREHGAYQTRRELIARTIGTTLIWTAMIGVFTFMQIVTNGDMPIISSMLVSIGSGASANIATHGFYNTLAYIFDFAPLMQGHPEEEDRSYEVLRASLAAAKKHMTEEIEAMREALRNSPSVILFNELLSNISRFGSRSSERINTRNVTILETISKKKDLTLLEANIASVLLPKIILYYAQADELSRRLTSRYRELLINELLDGFGLTVDQQKTVSDIYRRMFDAFPSDRLEFLEQYGLGDGIPSNLEEKFRFIRDQLTSLDIAINNLLLSKSPNNEQVDLGELLSLKPRMYLEESLNDLLRSQHGALPNERLKSTIDYFRIHYDIELLVPFAENPPQDLTKPIEEGVLTLYSENEIEDILSRLIFVERLLSALPRDHVFRSLTLQKLLIVKKMRDFWRHSQMVRDNMIALSLLDKTRIRQVLYHEYGHTLHGLDGSFAAYLEPGQILEILTRHKAFFKALDVDSLDIEKIKADPGKLLWDIFQIIFEAHFQKWKGFNAAIGIMDLNTPSEDYTEERARALHQRLVEEYKNFGILPHWSYTPSAPSMAVTYMFKKPKSDVTDNDYVRNDPRELIAEYTQLFLLYPEALERLDPVAYDFLSVILGATRFDQVWHSSADITQILYDYHSSITPSAIRDRVRVQAQPGAVIKRDIVFDRLGSELQFIMKELVENALDAQETGEIQVFLTVDRENNVVFRVRNGITDKNRKDLKRLEDTAREHARNGRMFLDENNVTCVQIDSPPVKIGEKARYVNEAWVDKIIGEQGMVGLIFIRGLTNKNIRNFGGKGVGLNVISNSIRRLGGQIKANLTGEENIVEFSVVLPTYVPEPFDFFYVSEPGAFDRHYKDLFGKLPKLPTEPEGPTSEIVADKGGVPVRGVLTVLVAATWYFLGLPYIGFALAGALFLDFGLPMLRNISPHRTNKLRMFLLALGAGFLVSKSVALGAVKDTIVYSSKDVVEAGGMQLLDWFVIGAAAAAILAAAYIIYIALTPVSTPTEPIEYAKFVKHYADKKKIALKVIKETLREDFLDMRIKNDTAFLHQLKERLFNLYKGVAQVAKDAAGHDFDVVFYPASGADIYAPVMYSDNIVTISANDIFRIVEDKIDVFKEQLSHAMSQKLYDGIYGAYIEQNFLRYAMELVLLGVDLESFRIVEKKRIEGATVTTVEFELNGRKIRHTHFQYTLTEETDASGPVMQEVSRLLKGKRVVLLSKAGASGTLGENLSLKSTWPVLPDNAVIVSDWEIERDLPADRLTDLKTDKIREQLGSMPTGIPGSPQAHVTFGTAEREDVKHDRLVLDYGYARNERHLYIARYSVKTIEERKFLAQSLESPPPLGGGMSVSDLEQKVLETPLESIDSLVSYVMVHGMYSQVPLIRETLNRNRQFTKLDAFSRVLAVKEAEMWLEKVENGTFESFAVVPDIHGNFRQLRQLIESLYRQGVRTFIFLGDYMDRGKENLKTIAYIVNLSKRAKVITNLGNHDLWFLHSVLGRDAVYDFWRDSFVNWLANGGLRVLKEVLEREIGKMGPELSQARRLTIESELEKIEEYIKVEEAAIANAEETSDALWTYWFGDKETRRVLPSYEITKIFREKLEDLARETQHNPTLAEIADWMQRNAQLYYENEYGLLFVHAGIPVDIDGVVRLLYGGREKLDALEGMNKDLKNAKNSEDQIFWRLLAKENEAVSPVLAGREVWSDRIRNAEIAESVLDQMRLNGIIYGHKTELRLVEEQYEPKIIRSGDNLIYGIDLGWSFEERDKFGGRGGVAVFSNQGIEVQRFRGHRIVKETLQTRDSLVEILKSRIARLSHRKPPTAVGGGVRLDHLTEKSPKEIIGWLEFTGLINLQAQSVREWLRERPEQAMKLHEFERLLVPAIVRHHLAAIRQEEMTRLYDESYWQDVFRSYGVEDLTKNAMPIIEYLEHVHEKIYSGSASPEEMRERLIHQVRVFTEGNILSAILMEKEFIYEDTRVGDLIYDEAEKIIPEIVNITRRHAPTYDLAPAFYEHISPTSNCTRDVEQVLGRQGHDIHSKHYAIGRDEDWFRNLTEQLIPMLEKFNADVNSELDVNGHSASRMIIRTMGRRLELMEIRRKELEQLNPENAVRVKEVLERVHIIDVDIGEARYLNPVIDLFADMGIMEIDRYEQKDYSGEAPITLKDNLVSLLRLSAANLGKLTSDNLSAILKQLFSGTLPLEIRVIDWASIPKQKQAHDKILQAL